MEVGGLRPEEQDQNEPILRGEYERRHQELQDKYETFSRRTYRILAVFFLGLLATGGAAAYLLNENSNRTDEITTSQITNCETSGNPLRASVRTIGNTLITQTNKQIEQSEGFEKAGTYDEFFPGYPRDKLHELLVEGREDQRDEIHGLRKGVKQAHAINCKARYGP